MGDHDDHTTITTRFLPCIRPFCAFFQHFDLDEFWMSMGGA